MGKYIDYVTRMRAAREKALNENAARLHDTTPKQEGPALGIAHDANARYANIIKALQSRRMV